MSPCCTAPGFTGTLAHYAVPVYISLNGGVDFGSGHSRTFTYKTDDIQVGRSRFTLSNSRESACK